MNVNFLVGGYLEWSGVVIEYNLQKIIRDIALCINFMMLEVNVPVKFSGT